MDTAKPRRSQLLVYMDQQLLDRIAHAVHLGRESGSGPATLSELVRDAVEAHLSELSRSLNRGKPFDPEVGGRVRDAARRSRCGD